MAKMEDTRNRQSNFNITSDEVSQFKEALKHEEFRNLLIEYSKEVSDPKNRELYESEIVEYEREQGSEIEFIEPCGNYVIKTWNSAGGKVMINICTASKVDEPVCHSSEENNGGQDWSIPFIIGSSRQEIDRKKQLCAVIDILFHDQTLHLAQTLPAFRNLVHNTALDATETFLKSQLTRQHLKFPKMKYKGAIQKCMLRTIKKQTPEYEFVYRENSLGLKTALIIKIDLLLLSSIANCCLDVTDSTLQLKHEKYNDLVLSLPLTVNSEKGKATFNDLSKKLIVELPTYESSQDLNSIPLANNSINNKIQQVQNNQIEINAIINECQAMTLDNNTSDETADSSDSENNKNVSNNENPNSNSENLNDFDKLESGDDQVENMVVEDDKSTTNHSSNVSQSNNDTESLLNNFTKEDATDLDNSTPNNNYCWNENNLNLTTNINKKKQQRVQALKTRSFSESSDDWSLGQSLSHSPCKGILKGYSVSGGEEMCESMEQATTRLREEDEEEEEAEGGLPCSTSQHAAGSTSSVKKSVSFSDVISKQLFRPDSSILGQRKKNQRRARNKRKGPGSGKRLNSESEGDVGSEAEGAAPPRSNSSCATQAAAARAAEFTSDLMFDIDM